MIGISGPGTSPLAVDYVKNKSRGKASAYIGLFAGIGVIFGMFVMFSLTKEMPYTQSYTIEALFTFCMALFFLFAVKDGKIEKKHVEDLPFGERIKVKYHQLIDELSTKIELSLCLVGSVICRMLNLISTVYINLWISTFYGRD